MRRDGGETAGIGWKRGFVTSLKPELRVTATCADPHARGFSWCASPPAPLAAGAADSAFATHSEQRCCVGPFIS